MPYQKVCEACKRKYETVRPRQRWCSKKCLGVHYKKREVRPCPTCGKQVEFGGRNRRLVTIFCSKRCRALFTTVGCPVLYPAAAGYLAGLLDGEGSIVAQKRPDGTVKSYRLTIANTHVGVLHWCKALTGLGRVYVQTKPTRSLDPKRPNAHLTYKVCWVWAVSGVKAVSILKQLLPYLQIKRDRAVTAVEALRA